MTKREKVKKKGVELQQGSRETLVLPLTTTSHAPVDTEAMRSGSA